MSDARKNLEDIIAKAAGLGGDDVSKLVGTFSASTVTCRACKQKNRLKPGKTDARCGKCGLPLK